MNLKKAEKILNYCGVEKIFIENLGLQSAKHIANIINNNRDKYYLGNSNKVCICYDSYYKKYRIFVSNISSGCRHYENPEQELENCEDLRIVKIF